MWLKRLNSKYSFAQLQLHNIVDPWWEMIAFGLQGMFPWLRKNLYFYWKKAFKKRVLAICGKEDCLIEITFSLHPYDLKDLMLMRKLTIR